MSSDTDAPSLATQAFQHRATAENYRLLAQASDDEKWREYYLVLAASYAHLAEELDRSGAEVRRLDARTLEIRARHPVRPDVKKSPDTATDEEPE